MSYLSKKAVLESIDAKQIRLMGEYQSVTGYHKRYVTGKYDGLNWVKHQIQSGAFDADNTEIQRLRAALEKARQYIVNGYELGYIDDREGYTEALVREIDKALSGAREGEDVR